MKKVLMINGSPKGKNKSSSRVYLELIQARLPETCDYELIDMALGSYSLPDFSECDLLIFAFPLYVDGLPGVLTSWLERVEIQDLSRVKKTGPQVWVLVNSGFYEGRQNGPAIDIIGNFCRRMGFTWRGGLGVGSGAMIQALKDLPPRARIRRDVSKALDEMISEMTAALNADDFSEKSESHFSDGPVIRFAQYGMPWIMYQMGGHFGWRQKAVQNGLKARELNARPYSS